MQLTEFIEEITRRSKLPYDDDHRIPPAFVEKIIKAAEDQLPWENGHYYRDSVLDYADMLGEFWRLGGLCAWVDSKGTIYPLSYGGHSTIAGVLIDQRGWTGEHTRPEERMAHVSIAETPEQWVRYTGVEYVTDKMMFSIYRFCLTVNQLPAVRAQGKLPYEGVLGTIEEINRNQQHERKIIRPFDTAEWEPMTSCFRDYRELANM